MVSMINSGNVVYLGVNLLNDVGLYHFRAADELSWSIGGQIVAFYLFRVVRGNVYFFGFHSEVVKGFIKRAY
jgi:hypothetical protein